MDKKPVIAIVDDDQSAREGIVDLVSSMGFEAQAFERAEDFLCSHQIACADCLITDVRMPGMNGLELLDRLLAAGKTIPAIVLTAFTQEADRVRALGAGAVCYMSKPVHESELMQCIGAALSSGSL
jgi:FixJ family two-component response regulator